MRHLKRSAHVALSVAYAVSMTMFLAEGAIAHAVCAGTAALAYGCLCGVKTST